MTSWSFLGRELTHGGGKGRTGGRTAETEIAYADAGCCGRRGSSGRGISYYIFSQTESPLHSEDGGGSGSHRDPGVFYKLGDPKEGILVNVGGGRAGKFLKAGIVLELNPGKSENVTDGKVGSVAETKILDTTMQFLRAAPLEEFDASKQDALKKQLKDALNERLGQGSVYDVYITSFLLQ